MNGLSPEDIDAVAYGIAKIFHTPLDQLRSEAAAHRASYGGPPLVGSKAGAWANQALDYALNTDSSYVAVAYLKPPPQNIYDTRSRWVVYMMPARQDLDAWYQATVESDRYHYVAAFDKTTPEWRAGRAVAVTAEPGAYTSGLFGDIEHAVKSAASDVAKVIQHPPGWLAVAMPLFTPGTQKWWAKKLGGKTGEELYDVGTQAVVQKALGPAGPKLLSAFNSVMDDAANGHLNAQEMIAKAPQIAHLAQASQHSPEALQQAIADTGSVVNVSGSNGRGEYGQKRGSIGTSVGAVTSTQRLRHLDHLVALHETYWAAYAQQRPSHQVYEFLRQHWDPFLTSWMTYRPYFDTEQDQIVLRRWLEQRHAEAPASYRAAPDDLLASFVQDSAQKLSSLREFASNNGIATPDLGTTQHGFISPEGLKVSGGPRVPYNADRSRKRP